MYIQVLLNDENNFVDDYGVFFLSKKNRFKIKVFRGNHKRCYRLWKILVIVQEILFFEWFTDRKRRKRFKQYYNTCRR